mmetsp:Transcript_59024/g.110586  ORF Transcript_59024/g.110586 Transcript_59024/m.110586 type:complete len:164 (+) Transcript_59024:92-583(+)
MGKLLFAACVAAVAGSVEETCLLQVEVAVDMPEAAGVNASATSNSSSVAIATGIAATSRNSTWGKESVALSTLGANASQTASQNASTAPSQPMILPACNYIWGLPKLAWALICDLLGIILLLLCIPFLLHTSRRRPYGAPILDFSFGPGLAPQKSTGCCDCLR